MSEVLHTERMLPSALEFIRGKTDTVPRIALVLGSGLGAIGNEVEGVRIPFGTVPGFAPVTVVGHAGSLVIGTLQGVPCAMLQGRYHLYEGHQPEHVAFPLRLLSELGATELIVTNAAGGVNPSLRPGDLMLIEDHLNLMGRNPLVGPVRPGEIRFPDMTDPYDAKLRRLAQTVAAEQGVELKSGVYAALLGPTYETRAEVRMLARLGADAVGMSTVPEVIVARARGMRVLGISLITNAAAGLGNEPLDHQEVLEAGMQRAGVFGALLRGIVRELGQRDHS